MLVYKGKAEVVEELGRPLRSAASKFPWPHVIRLLTYVRVPRIVQRKISRRALFARDGWRCVYCGTTSGRLTLDHVVPRSKGGESVWENVVTSCAPCNLRKGNRLPHEVQMELAPPAEAAGAGAVHPARGAEDPEALGAVPGGVRGDVDRRLSAVVGYTCTIVRPVPRRGDPRRPGRAARRRSTALPEDERERLRRRSRRAATSRSLDDDRPALRPPADRAADAATTDDVFGWGVWVAARRAATSPERRPSSWTDEDAVGSELLGLARDRAAPPDGCDRRSLPGTLAPPQRSTCCRRSSVDRRAASARLRAAREASALERARELAEPYQQACGLPALARQLVALLPLRPRARVEASLAAGEVQAVQRDARGDARAAVGDELARRQLGHAARSTAR